MKLIPLLCFAVSGLIARSATAATFVYTPEISAPPAYTPSHTVEVDDPREGTSIVFVPGRSTIRISTTLQTLDVDYSTLGDDPLSFTLAAPAGKIFDIQVPTWGISTFNVISFFGTDLVPEGWFEQDLRALGTTIDATTGAGYSLLGLDTSSGVRLTGPGGNAFEVTANGTLIPGAHYRFSSITWQTTVPASYDHDFAAQSNLEPATGVPLTYFDARTAGLPGETSTDPGAWFRLVDLPSVPEPGSSILLAMGAVAAIRRRRR